MSGLEDALRRAIEDIVDKRFAELRRELQAGESAPMDAYDSHHLPPDVRSKDRFHRLVKDVPEARKTGRIWTVPREAWRAWRNAKVKGRATNVSGDVADVVARLADRYRPTRAA